MKQYYFTCDCRKCSGADKELDSCLEGIVNNGGEIQLPIAEALHTQGTDLMKEPEEREKFLREAVGIRERYLHPLNLQAFI